MKKMYIDASNGIDEIALLRLLAEMLNHEFDVLPTLNKLFTVKANVTASKWIETLEVNETVKNHLIHVISASEKYGIKLTPKDLVMVGSLVYLLDLLQMDEILISPLPVKHHPMHETVLKGKLIIPCQNEMYCTPITLLVLMEVGVKTVKDAVVKMEHYYIGKGQKGRQAIAYTYEEDADEGDEIIELVCNLDDMSAEYLAFAEEELYRAGALEVYTTSIYMKKGRLGVMLTCMCRQSDRQKMLELFFKHTTTIGVREYHASRYGLEKEITTMRTKIGNVHEKVSEGYGVKRVKYEYEDLARIARRKNMTLNEVKQLLKQEK